MKLNFWQWLGVLLMIGGIALWVYERGKDDVKRESATTMQGK